MMDAPSLRLLPHRPLRGPHADPTPPSSSIQVVPRRSRAAAARSGWHASWPALWLLFCLSSSLVMLGFTARAHAMESPAAVDAAARESLGMYVASLQSSLQRGAAVRGVAEPTEHQAGALALLVRDVQGVRRHLQTTARRLAPQSHHAKVMQQFLDEWPEDRLTEGTQAAPRHTELDREVRQLARSFPEARQVAPPFRLFRP